MAHTGPRRRLRMRQALFVIDENGTIARADCLPLAVNPGADGIL